jgi:hypothetical protein
MLLLVASRRRGEHVPRSVVGVVRGPVGITAVGAIYLAGVLVQGFVIWQRPGQRILAALAAGMMILVTWLAARRGAFRPRSVIELRRDPNGTGVITVTTSGAPADVSISVDENGSERGFRGSGGPLARFDVLRSACVELPVSEARQLKVWVHGVTAEGDSERIEAEIMLEPETDGARSRADDDATSFELDDRFAKVRVTLGGRDA